MVLHLPAAPDHEADVGPQDAVAGAAGQFGFLQNMDAAAFHLAVPDEEGRGGQAGQPAAYQPGLFVFHPGGFAGTGERFIIAIGVVHSVPPVPAGSARRMCCV